MGGEWDWWVGEWDRWVSEIGRWGVSGIGGLGSGTGG